MLREARNTSRDMTFGPGHVWFPMRRVCTVPRCRGFHSFTWTFTAGDPCGLARVERSLRISPVDSHGSRRLLEMMLLGAWSMGS